MHALGSVSTNRTVIFEDSSFVGYEVNGFFGAAGNLFGGHLEFIQSKIVEPGGVLKSDADCVALMDA